MTNGHLSIGRLTEDTVKDTDAWTRAENKTAIEKGSHMVQPKVTIRKASPQVCTTTDVAGRGNATGPTHSDGTTPTGGKAAGVSTNEGGVEPGPIAHPPR